MPYALDPCLFDDQSLELPELRALIQEYDELYELCMTHQMSPDDQRELNNIYDCLAMKEQELWRDTLDEVQALIVERTPCFFPMIRQTLGILPDEEEFYGRGNHEVSA